MRQFCALVLSLGLLLPGSVCPESSRLFPAAEDLELRTFRNTSVGGTLVQNEAGEGDCFYTITAEPVKGSVVLEEDGSFVYSPREGKRGQDTFHYQVMDSQGKVSREAAVVIRIEKQKTEVYYQDMRGRREAYAAALLCERGLFTGEQVAGTYCFSPEKAVTRGEFLAICMCLSRKPMLNAVQSTGCADDAAIPVWMKGYVVSASLQGIETQWEQSFEPNAPVTGAEAVHLLGETVGIEAPFSLEPDAVLSRADMALLLASALEE